MKIADTTLYAPVVILSTEDNAKLLQQMKWDFKRTVNWSKYWSKATLQAQNEYLDYVIDSEIKLSFLFENNAVRAHNIFSSTI